MNIKSFSSIIAALALSACSPKETAKPAAMNAEPAAAKLEQVIKPAVTNQPPPVEDARNMLAKASVPTFVNTKDLLGTAQKKLANAAEEIYKLTQSNNHKAAFNLADQTLKETFNPQLFGVIKREPNYLYMHLVKAYSASVTGASHEEVKALYTTAIQEAHAGCLGNDTAMNQIANSLFANAANYAQKYDPQLIAPGSAWAIVIGNVLNRINSAK